MYRFYFPQLKHILSPDGGQIELDSDQSHHVRRVLRLKVGDKIEGFDGQGGVVQGVIQEGADKVVVVAGPVVVRERGRPFLEIAAAVPKGPRFDQMINQLCQLGVDRFVPLECERSVVIPGGMKLERLERITIEAAKQSRQDYLMQIGAMRSVADVLGDQRAVRMMCDLNPSRRGDDILMNVRNAERIIVMVGPEGGWTEQERDMAHKSGCVVWGLNAGVLRIETACVTAAGVLRYVCESLSYD